MSKWKVSVCRIVYSHLDIVVEAESERDATEKAIDVAGDYEFSEHDADYTSDGATEVTA